MENQILKVKHLLAWLESAKLEDKEDLAAVCKLYELESEGAWTYSVRTLRGRFIETDAEDELPEDVAAIVAKHVPADDDLLFEAPADNPAPTKPVKKSDPTALIMLGIAIISTVQAIWPSWQLNWFGKEWPILIENWITGTSVFIVFITVIIAFRVRKPKSNQPADAGK